MNARLIGALAKEIVDDMELLATYDSQLFFVFCEAVHELRIAIESGQFTDVELTMLFEGTIEQKIADRDRAS